MPEPTKAIVSDFVVPKNVHKLQKLFSECVPVQGPPYGETAHFVHEVDASGYFSEARYTNQLRRKTLMVQKVLPSHLSQDH